MLKDVRELSEPSNETFASNRFIYCDIWLAQILRERYSIVKQDEKVEIGSVKDYLGMVEKMRRA